MLISYKVSNFCSFYEQAEFEMLAPNTVVKKRFPDSFVKHFSELEVLRTAVIIGENAGGKTNFIRSLEFLKKMFQNNENAHSFKSLVNINNRENNSRDLDNTCQHFELEILGENGLIYKYILEIDAFGIVKENLSVKKRKNAIYREILATTRKEITHQEEEHKFTLNYELKLSKENEKLEEVLNKAGTYTRNEIGLFVTKLAILGDEHANTFTNWINNNLYVEAMDLNYDIYKNIKREEDDIRILKDDRFIDILKMVDHSIVDVQIDDEKPFSKSVIVRKLKNDTTFSVELQKDSAGVREFFAWAVQIFRVVYENKIVIADEMDRVLNPVLSEQVIAYINGKKHMGQFIFSTHNVLHLDLKTYMKEQIYFITKKKEDLNSELYSLADFPEVRYETSKIYEFYMKGILGGTAFE